MPHYDCIAPDYNNYRSDSIGIATLCHYLKSFDWNAEVLDLGCGTGKPIATAVAEKVTSYTGVEISASMAAKFKQAVPKAKCIVADMASVDLGQQAFNVCFSWGALCHLEPSQQQLALSLAIRHTRIGGLILFTGGPEPGRCRGTVGPHEVWHYSLGSDCYDHFFEIHDCVPLFKGNVEDGAAFLFAYERTH